MNRHEFKIDAEALKEAERFGGRISGIEEGETVYLGKLGSWQTKHYLLFTEGLVQDEIFTEWLKENRPEVFI